MAAVAPTTSKLPIPTIAPMIMTMMTTTSETPRSQYCANRLIDGSYCDADLRDLIRCRQQTDELFISCDGAGCSIANNNNSSNNSNNNNNETTMIIIGTDQCNQPLPPPVCEMFIFQNNNNNNSLNSRFVSW